MEPQYNFFIGDSGYPLQPWLLTPILRPRTPEEERFNTSLCKTRVCVERAFGLLKSRFRCLDNTGGILCYPVERTCKIIMTCCVLHNICLQRRIPLPDDVVQLANDPNQPGVGQDVAVNNRDRGGIDVRNEIIRTWFTQ
nr:putative nuclease HARBI1 [Lytechinus pictus]